MVDKSVIQVIPPLTALGSFALSKTINNEK